MTDCGLAYVLAQALSARAAHRLYAMPKFAAALQGLYDHRDPAAAAADDGDAAFQHQIDGPGLRAHPRAPA